MNQKQREEYALTLERFLEEGGKDWQSYRDIIHDLDLLHRNETSLHRISEIQCSVEMTEKEEAQLQKRESNIEKRVEEIVAKYGFKVQFNGDPRGGAIRLLLPSGKSNNWDGKTWGIYW